MASATCCTIDYGIEADETQCISGTGGISDVRISCRKWVSTVTKVACPDGRISDIVTVDELAAPAPSFHRFEVKERQSGFAFEDTFEPDTDAETRTETLTLVLNIKTKAAYCLLHDMLGQQVTTIFMENGTDNYYVAGYAGGMYVTSVSGGTGTDTVQNITVVMTNPRVGANRFLRVEAASPSATATLLSTITV